VSQVELLVQRRFLFGKLRGSATGFQLWGAGSSAAVCRLVPGGTSQGGYSSDIVVDENYVIRVPEKMHKPAAAPLLCAGITCYSPFRHFGLKPGMILGVAGLGGLGHMGVKIGKAMGCEVVVLTRSEHKRESAMKLGASKVILTTDVDQMKEAAKSMHMIYNSIAFNHDLKQYLGLLRTSGTMVMVGGIPDALGVSSFDLLPRRLSIVGSCIGGIRETQEMIDLRKHRFSSWFDEDRIYIRKFFNRD
jgi:uncharacterized zinc-type alcohol dehydrogenase-like protein